MHFRTGELLGDDSFVKRLQSARMLAACNASARTCFAWDLSISKAVGESFKLPALSMMSAVS
jgi:hypothetical protein